MLLRPSIARLALLALCLSALAASSPAAPVRPVQGPSSGGIDVGVFYPSYAGSQYTLDITFGGVSATNVRFDVVLWDPDTGEPRVIELHCTVPPHVAGTVDVLVNYVPVGDKPPLPADVFPGAFTYLGAPILSSISPAQFTFKNDQRTCTITGTGFPLDQAPKVLFGSRSASKVSVNSEGTKLTVTPPPFPGGPIPLAEDVSVVTQGGALATLPRAFSYTRLAPTVIGINGRSGPAWRLGISSSFYVDYFVEGTVFVYIDKFLAATRTKSGDPEDNIVSLTLPAFPPGYYTVRIVNGDGGETILKDRIRIYGEAEARFHAADLDENYQINVSEIIRIIQFFNTGGLHCDESTEDSYAPGLDGDHTCAPHSSDYDPQNWEITLPELLELVQFYNLNCYKPCEEGSGFCPPV